jgi:hypothetical protein
MLMSFLMSMSPSSAACFDLYAVAAAFFISGGAAVTPAVFAQDLDVGKSFGDAELPISQGNGTGVGIITPTASVGGGGMSVGSQQLLSPLPAPLSLTRPASVGGGVGGAAVGGSSTAPIAAAPKRYTT